MHERLVFAEWGVTWPRARVQRTAFTDEVWAMGGAHTTSYVTVKVDGSDRLLPECLRHKYSKVPAWMFYGIIVDGKKGPGIFWEKEWGTITAAKYDEHILPVVQRFFREHILEGYLMWQDNAPAHAAYETHLNLIEHVWNYMKNWIQEHYWEARYRVDQVPLDQLRQIVLSAWNAVPDEFIQRLYNSWWRRCQAVINAQGGPTKY
ncbi:hypothetical protein BKA61DRAFT_550038 [Leptodontidium sp. MPI-SDFR-AT-0119]|nr:hypothetical protein BKA61DRAFT_550038 [Leptodontidium sp. MPI-SDFR-AT-0119]